MKIVHIITRLILGGAQENTLISCRLLAQRGHDVTLITGPAIGPEGELFFQTQNQPYKVIILQRMIRPIRPVNDLIAYFQLKKILSSLNPDIVHTHSAKAGILGRIAAYSLKKNNTRKPLIIHGVHGLSFHKYQNSLINRFYIAIEKFTAKKTDFFITVADAMTKQSLDAGIGRPEQYKTAYSAIDEDAFLNPIPKEQLSLFRQKYGIPENAVLLVTIARLFELKGHDFIIESAKSLSKKYPDAYWLFVGNGNLADFYKKQIADIGLRDKIKFTGLLPPDQIPLAIQASDILVHCSLREGLARTLPQGLLCAKPAVTFSLDGAPEVINENTGRLVEPKNVSQLISACSELIENKSLRLSLGQTGRQSVKQKFAPDTMVGTIEAVYKKLLEQNTL